MVVISVPRRTPLGGIERGRKPCAGAFGCVKLRFAFPGGARNPKTGDVRGRDREMENERKGHKQEIKLSHKPTPGTADGGKGRDGWEMHGGD